METEHLKELYLILIFLPYSSLEFHGVDFDPFESCHEGNEYHIEVQEVLGKPPSLLLGIKTGVEQDETNQHETNCDS